MISGSSFYAGPCMSGCDGVYRRNIKDADGDIIFICSYPGRCPYKRVVSDVDGDFIEICNE